MSNPGFNKGSVRWAEFVKHVHRLEEVFASKNTTSASFDKIERLFGALKFKGTRAYSYDMLIGKVWLKEQVIVWNEDADKTSKTTGIHLRGVRNAAFDLRQYIYLAANSSEMEDHPRTILRRRFPSLTEVSDSELNDVLDFLGNVVPNLNRRWADGVRILTKNEREKLTKDYVNATPDERLNIRGLLELAAGSIT